jgi:hypothetical protein
LGKIKEIAGAAILKVFLTKAKISTAFVDKGCGICLVTHVRNCILKNSRRIVYRPFRYSVNDLKGYDEVNARDTLITLAHKRDFTTAVKLAEGQHANDGASSTIVVAFKTNRKYEFETCRIPPFYFKPIYKKL